MPRTANPANVAKQLTLLLTRLVAAEVSRAVARLPKAAPGRPAAAGKTGRRKLKLSPEARKKRQQQGQYMSLVRALPATKKAALAKLHREKGYSAAIAAAKKLQK